MGYGDGWYGVCVFVWYGVGGGECEYDVVVVMVEDGVGMC